MEDHVASVDGGDRTKVTVVDRSICSREPIHIPGAIQPHGSLVAIDPVDNLTIVAASRNLREILDLPLSSDEIVGRSVGDSLGEAFAASVRQRLRDGRLRGEAPWQSSRRLADRPLIVDFAVHAHAGLVIVEIQRRDGLTQADPLISLFGLQEAIAEVRGA
jgi:chemotaxis family two-component system sensor kinase Cph1